MPQRIQPRVLKGFRDYLPETMIPRERLMEVARGVFRSYGFRPIDTPALEYLEILLGKGSDETDKQLYQFTDAGGRQVGLRFDLTVPLARFAAQHAGTLGTPFKRYHLATVWRGENTQRGRYREFMQCDFDTIGTTSVVSDLETLLVIHDVMQAIGLERFTIHVNNRVILNGLLGEVGLGDQATLVLRSLDKLAKVGRAAVIAEIEDSTGAARQQAETILDLVELTGTNQEILTLLRTRLASCPAALEGIERLADIVAGARAAGIASERVQIDIAIARGLDYYTGTVFETVLDDLPGIGSVASGGRYDNLAEVYTSQQLPGVGASLGLDRLLAAMDELGILPRAQTPADVFLPFFAADRLDDYLALASRLREAGFGVELYPEPKKLGKQLQYADKLGYAVALIAGSEELASHTCQLKNLATGESEVVDLGEPLVAALHQLLGK